MLLYGDVEPSPIPKSKAHVDSLSQIKYFLIQLHEGQTGVVDQLKEITDGHKRTSDSFSALQTRVGTIETDLAVCKSQANVAMEIETKVKSGLSQIKFLKQGSCNAESRFRRFNLLFFLPWYAATEMSTVSEKLVLQIGREGLGIQVNLDAIERANRTGRMNLAKNRPITVNFYFFLMIKKLC